MTRQGGLLNWWMNFMIVMLILLPVPVVRPKIYINGQRLKAMFERTSSRLLEMQSEEYMALEHRP